MADPMPEADGAELRVAAGEETFGTEAPDGADPPLLLQKSGRRMHASASHHRLNAT